MAKLSENAKAKAKALNTRNVKDLTLKEVGKAAWTKVTQYAATGADIVNKGVSVVIPADPDQRAVNEAESHIANEDRADKVRYAVNLSTGWAGSLLKGVVAGVKDSFNENVRGKASSGASRVLDEELKDSKQD
jgi:hypothetical protein